MLILFGVALIAVAPLVGLNYYRAKRVLLKDSVTLDIGEVSSLSFPVDSVRAGYLVRIFVNVTAVNVGPTIVSPILDIIVVDQQGFDLVEKNQSANYAYVRALGIQSATLLTANNIKQAGEYYIVFENRFPVSTDVPVTIADEWDQWAVYIQFYLLIIVGVAVAVVGAVWKRVARQMKVPKAR